MTLFLTRCKRRLEHQDFHNSGPEWDIRRKGRAWTQEEFERRIYQAPEKIEFAGGILAGEEERLTVLAMLQENLGIEAAVRLGNPEDWKAAIAEREQNWNYLADLERIQNLKAEHDDPHR